MTEQELILKLIKGNEDSLKIARQWETAYKLSAAQFDELAKLHINLLQKKDNYKVAAHAAIKSAENWQDKCETAKINVEEMKKVRLS